MPAPLLILAALAVSQAAATPPPPSQPVASGHARAFISPMGEPFHVAGFDGLAAWFQQADSNHDGSLFVDEVRKDAERFFLTLDRNHDGEIDPDEIERYENVVAPETGVVVTPAVTLVTVSESPFGSVSFARTLPATTTAMPLLLTPTLSGVLPTAVYESPPTMGA